ncbi:MAG: hypothetical protein IPO87_15710 [Flavobacteriales bacterium]|nr:hypothetical protein [Flavobacteriales bacterium]
MSVLCAANPTMFLLADPLPLVLGMGGFSGTAVASPTDASSRPSKAVGQTLTLDPLFNGPCGQPEDAVTLSLQECEWVLAKPPNAASVLFHLNQERITVKGLFRLERVEVFDAMGVL